MQIPAATVKQLRDRTSLGMMECKRALEEAEGDLAKAQKILRKRGLKAAELRQSRSTAEGSIGHYVHINGRIGVLVELNCETDFVTRNEEFERLLKDLCMQVAATRPLYATPEEIPAEELDREKEIASAQFKDKPPQVAEKIAQGKLKEFYKQVCLLDQPFIKDASQTVRERVNAVNAKLGENIVVRRFVRFEVGEEV